MKLLRRAIPIMILAVMLLAGNYLFLQRGMPRQDAPKAVNGIIDMTGINLDTTLGYVPVNWDFYPQKLYSPADFASGSTIPAVQRKTLNNPDGIPYGTHRVHLKLPENKYYLLCGYSTDYSMRMFVSGDIVYEIGNVADNAFSSVPGVDYYTVPVFSGESGVVELILQYSNFVHFEGGGIPIMHISKPSNMEQHKTYGTLIVYLVCGGLILLSVYYLIDYCIRQKRETAAFAFCCLLFAIRNQRFYLTQLMGYGYNWYINYRVVVAVIILAVFAIYILLDSLYPKVMNKWVTRIFTCITVLFCVLLFILPTQYAVSISVAGYIVSSPFLLAFITKLIIWFIKEKCFSAQDAVICLGVATLMGGLIVEIMLQRSRPSVTRDGALPLCMLVFVLAMMLVLSLRSNKDAADLVFARKEKSELQKLYRLRSEFLETLSHEMRTPLTVMSGYAQLANMNIKNNTCNEQTTLGLVQISLEAQRLAMLTEQLLEHPVEYAGTGQITEAVMGDVLERAKGICGPILAKNNNSLTIKAYNLNAVLLVNIDTFIQIVLNLCTNANRFTKNDLIELKAEQSEGMAVFVFTDHGAGIAKEQLNKIWQRGYSGDGHTGIGLSVCRDAIEAMGGQIALSSEQAKGTSVTFTVPLAKRGNEV